MPQIENTNQTIKSKKPFDSCHYSEKQKEDRQDNEALKEVIRRF